MAVYLFMRNICSYKRRHSRRLEAYSSCERFDNLQFLRNINAKKSLHLCYVEIEKRLEFNNAIVGLFTPVR